MENLAVKHLENWISRGTTFTIFSRIKDLTRYLLDHPQEALRVKVLASKIVDLLVVSRGEVPFGGKRIQDSSCHVALTALSLVLFCMEIPADQNLSIPSPCCSFQQSLLDLSHRILACSCLEDLRNCRRDLMEIQAQNEVRNPAPNTDAIDFVVYELENLMDISESIVRMFVVQKIPFSAIPYQALLSEYDPAKGDLNGYLQHFSFFQMQ